MERNTSIDREFHALPDSKKNFVPREDLHLKNLILVGTGSKENGKGDIISYKFPLIRMFYTRLKRAFKTEQNVVFEARISLISHAHLSEIKFERHK